MTDIQSSQRPILDHFGTVLNRSANNVSVTPEGATSNNVYTYIGITEPDKVHVYENQTVVNKTKMAFDHKRHETM